MKRTQYLLISISRSVLMAMGAAVLSCDKNTDPITSEIVQTVSNESTQNSQQDEVDDIATGQLNTIDNAGRIISASDDRVSCAFITRDTTSNKETGTLTINFDKDTGGNTNTSGCTDPRGNVRKGSLTITWTGGRWYSVGSSIVIVFNNYTINGVVVAGYRNLNNVTVQTTKPTWNIASNLTSTWPDATTATRTDNKTRQWDIAGATITVTPVTNTDSTASGKNRYGKNFRVGISSGLVYDISCISTSKVYSPVSGIEVITIDTNKEITLNFGAGACDNILTFTYGGQSETIVMKNDGSAD